MSRTRIMRRSGLARRRRSGSHNRGLSGRRAGRRQTKPRSFGKRLVVLMAFMVIAAVIITLFIDNKVRPMIELYGHNQATTTGTQAIHKAVEAVIAEKSISYNDLSSVNRTENGAISSIETNSYNMNVIKSMVSDKVLEEIGANGSQNVKIPVGSLVGGLMTGRGPSVTIKVPMNSNVQVHFSSEFGSAGINQTRHIIGMKVEITTLIVAQGSPKEVTVISDFVLAEHIIIGEVPNWVSGNMVS